MVGDSDLANDRASDYREGAATPPPRQRAAPGERVQRKQAKFSRPVRLALLIGLPLVLWTAIYVVISRLV
jgi:hypothetical protein